MKVNLQMAYLLCQGSVFFKTYKAEYNINRLLIKFLYKIAK